MHMLSRRLQVLLDDRQYARLAAYAAERNLSVGAAVREALDRAVPLGAAGRAAALQGIVEATEMTVPDAAALRRELDELRGRRG